MNTRTDGRAVPFRHRFVLLLVILPVAAGTAAAADQKTIDELLKKTFVPKEIPCAAETKTREQLQVELPAKNENFNSLALALAKNLPREPELPKDKPSALRWQEAKRAALGEIVKAKQFDVAPIKFASQEKAGLKVTSWKFQMGGVWTVPAVELAEGTPGQTAVLIADGGRAAAAADVTGLLAAGYRVIAADPLNLGESSLQNGWLFCLFLAAVGDRPLGLQTSQVVAIARWADAEYHAPVTVAGVGRRCCVAALVAADLEPKAIGQVRLRGSLGSLKELIEQNVAFNDAGGQELFCFGLLESLDIKRLAALAAPRPAIFLEPSDRTKTETADLAAWRRLFGSQ
jgi:hypothetical protein